MCLVESFDVSVLRMSLFVSDTKHIYLHLFSGKCSKCGAEDGLTHLEMKEAKAEAAMKKQLARTLSRPSFLPIVDIGVGGVWCSVA
jgi:hypothetical protein